MSAAMSTTGTISCLYICQSPVLLGCKIGHHKGTLKGLFDRYRTSLTNGVYFYLFETENREEHEKIVHRILKPYSIGNELFRKQSVPSAPQEEHQQQQQLVLLYIYMAKMVTGCARVRCYSREKYGFPRSKGKWQYLKKEIAEENEINDVMDDIARTGIIPEDDAAAAMSPLLLLGANGPSSSEEEQLEGGGGNDAAAADDNNEDAAAAAAEGIYLDNPFVKFAFRGAK